MKKALVIGGGAAGVAAAHQLRLLNDWEITLVEKAPFLGAGVRTFYHGGHPYTFGPRHFLTQNEKVFNYINNLLPMRRIEHQFWSYVEQDQQFYNFPIHVDDIERMPDRDKIKKELELSSSSKPFNLEEYWLQKVGPTLYHKFIKKYNEKMWRTDPIVLDTFSWSPKGTPLKSGPRTAWDTAISAYPLAPDGYNSWFDIATSGVDVRLSTEVRNYDFQNKIVWINWERLSYDIIVSTISPDIPFGQFYGALPYLGRDFYKIVLPVEYALPPDVFWIYDVGYEKWTRTTEFKKFTQYKSDQTLIGMEVPSTNGKFYPLPIKKWQNLANQYFKMMGAGVYCMGRNGSYRYSIDIAASIEQAFGLVELLQAGGQDHPVIGKWSQI